jgi:hypothetical protein
MEENEKCDKIFPFEKDIYACIQTFSQLSINVSFIVD